MYSMSMPNGDVVELRIIRVRFMTDRLCELLLAAPDGGLFYEYAEAR